MGKFSNFKIILDINSNRCYYLLNIKKPMNKSSRNKLLVPRESLVGGNATTRIILNGLVREAPNPSWRVGAYGNPVRYQLGVYDSIQKEWAIFIVNLGGTTEA